MDSDTISDLNIGCMPMWWLSNLMWHRRHRLMRFERLLIVSSEKRSNICRLSTFFLILLYNPISNIWHAFLAEASLYEQKTHMSPSLFLHLSELSLFQLELLVTSDSSVPSARKTFIGGSSIHGTFEGDELFTELKIYKYGGFSKLLRHSFK